MSSQSKVQQTQKRQWKAPQGAKDSNKLGLQTEDYGNHGQPSAFGARQGGGFNNRQNFTGGGFGNEFNAQD